MREFVSGLRHRNSPALAERVELNDIPEIHVHLENIAENCALSRGEKNSIMYQDKNQELRIMNKELRKRTFVKDSLEKIGEEIVVFGFVQTIRAHGKIAFFDLRDGTGVVQVAGIGEEKAHEISSLNPQDIVQITGIVKRREERYVNKEIATGEIEIEAENVQIIQKSESMPFDMGGKELHLELPTLLDYRSLTLRHPTVFPIFKVQAKITEGFFEIAEKLGCVEIFVPTIVASATEGGAEVFPIEYYQHKAYLSQSPQLYKQMLVPVFERVFTIAHAYRAEPSVTTRHLSESTQMDCEFGFVDFDMLLDLLEEVGVHIFKHVEKTCKEELKLYNAEPIRFGKIPRLKLREAQEIIFKEFGRDVRAEKDLAPQDEIDICSWALKNHKSDFVTITHFPTQTKPFYTMPDQKDPEFSLSYDLLFKGTEILSGSQRINQYDQLVGSLKNRGMDSSAFELYLQAFKYGMPPEGGFSFGLERITWKLLGLQNIREASLYPRDMERIDERFSKLSDHQKNK